MNAKEENRAPEARQRTSRVPPRHPDPRIPNYRDPDDPGSRSRIRRPEARWHGLEEASRLAQIIVLEHGGNTDPVIKRGQKHLRSRMGSRKTGLQQVVEGRGHRDLAMWNEAHPRILDYQAHPFHIRGQIADRRFDYYPDHIRLWRDGRIELIEVKRSPEDLADSAYRHKLGAVAEIVRRCGWRFRVLYHADITGPRWRMPNVEAVYARRYMLVNRSEQDAITAFVLRGEPTTWAALRDRVAPGDRRRGDAVLENAIALGRIEVDLDRRIAGETPVTPLNPVPHNRRIRI